MLPLIVFSDLDGTLLDHAGYGHAPARPALARLAALGIPVVLATSKTAAEIAPLQRDMGLAAWPAIVENGAARTTPGAARTAPADEYERIRACLAALPAALRARFRGFGDLSEAEVSEITGLSPEAARLARRRDFTEPGLWSGGDGELAQFLEALGRSGITARRGGRFLTLSFGRTKADLMAEIRDEFRPEFTLALGDAPNDIEMIEAADRGVIVRNDHGPGIPRLPAEAAGRIIRTDLPGPSGWNQAVLDLLSELGFTEGEG